MITSQSPAGGTLVGQYDSVVITCEKTDLDGPDATGIREPRRPRPTPKDVGVVAWLLDDHGPDIELADR